MQVNDFSNLTITDVQFLPIVKEYARRINLVDTINHMVDTEMELQPGPVVLGMVLDTLSGRSPLYRLMNFLEEKDIELLLGKAVSISQFTDHNIFDFACLIFGFISFGCNYPAIHSSHYCPLHEVSNKYW